MSSDEWLVRGRAVGQVAQPRDGAAPALGRLDDVGEVLELGPQVAVVAADPRPAGHVAERRRFVDEVLEPAEDGLVEPHPRPVDQQEAPVAPGERGEQPREGDLLARDRHRDAEVEPVQVARRRAVHDDARRRVQVEVARDVRRVDAHVAGRLERGQHPVGEVERVEPGEAVLQTHLEALEARDRAHRGLRLLPDLRLGARVAERVGGRTVERDGTRRAVVPGVLPGPGELRVLG
ncbi:hypothetical protein [Isoptericola variabilis]|uniref:hypothetical protein n=1 Tax=Isoptericola variabilis TaxID=139208 RepID=UPI00119DE88E|nr:hypothetical protein [Isoptericola variabilis]